MKPIIVSVYKDNVPVAFRDAQHRVVSAFAPGVDFVQIESECHLTDLDRINGTPHNAHPLGIERTLAEDVDHDTFLFLDIDAIPLNKLIIPWMLDLAQEYALVGCAQRAGGRYAESNHFYVGPFAMAITRGTYEALGRPSFQATGRADVGEELTYACEALGLPTIMLEPTHTMGPEFWPFRGDKMYGLGTTYADSIFHLFLSRFSQTHPLFLWKCEEILRTGTPVATR